MKIALAAVSAAALLGLSACAEEPAEDTTVIETETMAPVDAMAADPAMADPTLDPALADPALADPAATDAAAPVEGMDTPADPTVAQ